MRAGALKASAFAVALAADAAFGDPEAMPHPVRLFGFAIARAERFARAIANENPRAERALGFAIAVGIAGGTYAVAVAARERILGRSEWAADAYDALLGWTTIAAHDLLRESRAVREALEAGDVVRARERVARIVGRDTRALSPDEIARATIETLAESLCDGIVAPLSALALGGAPLALAFKSVSTMDSMIGHSEAPYTDLGFAAAKLDDALCWLPARVSALAIAIVAPLAGGSATDALATLRADGARHASPNAGRPEAAMAGALGVRLGGRNTYDGHAVDAPYLGAKFGEPHVFDVGRAEVLVVAAAVACAALALAVRAAIEAV